MSRALQGQYAMVTGAHRGIGQAVAQALGAAGAAVLCTDLLDGAETVADIEKAGGKAWAARCDVSDELSVEGLFKFARQILPRLDLVVHCAGIIHEKPLPETAIAE